MSLGRGHGEQVGLDLFDVRDRAHLVERLRRQDVRLRDHIDVAHGAGRAHLERRVHATLQRLRVRLDRPADRVHDEHQEEPGADEQRNRHEPGSAAPRISNPERHHAQVSLLIASSGRSVQPFATG